MSLHNQLIKNFYDEFPNAIGFIVFRHNQYLYPDVETDGFTETKRRLEENGNTTLRIYKRPLEGHTTDFCIIGTDDTPVFIDPLLDHFNDQSKIINDVHMEQEFIFFHETYHAIQYLNTRHAPNNAQSDFLDECCADAYASLRLIATYGDAALPLLRHIANQRILETNDAMHISTFTIDSVTQLGLMMQANGDFDGMHPAELMDIAQLVAGSDRLYGYMNDNHLESSSDIKNFIAAIPDALCLTTSHTDWLNDRYLTAAQEIKSQLQFNTNKYRPHP